MRGPSPVPVLRTRRWGSQLALTALLLAGASPAPGQTHERLAIGASAARSDIRMRGFGPDTERLTGVLVGVEAHASLWRFHTRGAYRQGRLAQGHLAGARTRVVDALASAGVRVLPRVVLAAGPRVSIIDTPAGDRWIVRWHVEIFGSAPLVTNLVSAFASVGGSVAGSELDRVFPPGGGGAEIGLVLAPPELPVRASLGYRIDRESLFLGSRQTRETSYVSLGVSLPGAREPLEARRR